jgi:hypothetical protein
MPIVSCNYNISDVFFSGYTINKIFGCGGQLVYDKEPCECPQCGDCNIGLGVPYVLNYNAKTYDPTTHTLPNTPNTGSNYYSCTLTGDTQNIVVYPDHLDLTNTTSVGGSLHPFMELNVKDYAAKLTIIAKCYKPTNTIDSDLIVNRSTSDYNWMFRWKKDCVVMESTSAVTGVSVSSSEPNIVYMYAYNGTNIPQDTSKVHFRNFSTCQENTIRPWRFNYNNVNQGGLFSEYARTTDGHFWKGNFYWIYVATKELSYDEIMQVIYYNENCIQ